MRTGRPRQHDDDRLSGLDALLARLISMSIVDVDLGPGPPDDVSHHGCLRRRWYVEARRFVQQEYVADLLARGGWQLPEEHK
jgi:hypothetical protein